MYVVVITPETIFNMSLADFIMLRLRSINLPYSDMKCCFMFARRLLTMCILSLNNLQKKVCEIYRLSVYGFLNTLFFCVLIAFFITVLIFSETDQYCSDFRIWHHTLAFGRQILRMTSGRSGVILSTSLHRVLSVCRKTCSTKSVSVPTIMVINEFIDLAK